MKKYSFACIVFYFFVFAIPVFAAGIKAKDYEVVHRYVMNDGVIMEICTESKAPEWFKLAAAQASLDSNSSSVTSGSYTINRRSFLPEILK